MAEPESPSDVGRVERFFGRIKHFTAVVVVLALIGIGTMFWKAVDVYTRTLDALHELTNPNEQQYAALRTLDLDTRVEFVEDKFGTSKRVFDLCHEPASCPGTPPSDLRMYMYETGNVAIRAIFQGDRMVAYAVTITSDELSPPVNWLGYHLGDLGSVTFKQALAAVPTVSEPTDTSVFMGAKAAAYAEVVASGGAGRYRGLLLAVSPTGYGGKGMTFDNDAANKISSRQLRGARPDAADLKRFRSRSTPDTYGEFRDDGNYVGNQMHDAEWVIPLLFTGTEL